MSTFFWAILVVVIIPLAQGVLLALVLREIHARHPLPLVEPGYVNAWYVPAPQNIIADSAEGEATPDESVAEGAADTAEVPVDENEPPSGEVSVFDGAAPPRTDFLVDEVIDSMMSAVPDTIPDAFENRIEESTRLKDGLPEEAHHIGDDLDIDDLEDLAAALPKTKIDFSQEESDSVIQEPISQTAKEILGDNFDLASLEMQASHTSAEASLDVQEDVVGMVQVSSPFLVTDSPQLVDISVPQTVFSTFSEDWVQESGDVLEPMVESVSNLCFTEESRPMFVRKKAN